MRNLLLCRVFILIVLLAVLYGSPSPAAAQDDAEPAAADQAYSAKQWPRAEALYAALVRQSPETARFWFRLGVAQRGNQHFDAALQSFDRARRLGAGKGLPPFVVDYEVAETWPGGANKALPWKS